MQPMHRLGPRLFIGLLGVLLGGGAGASPAYAQAKTQDDPRGHLGVRRAEHDPADGAHQRDGNPLANSR